MIFGLMPLTICYHFSAIGIAYLRDCGLTSAATICRYLVAAEIRKNRMSLISPCCQELDQITYLAFA